jgi:hypothetical protein
MKWSQIYEHRLEQYKQAQKTLKEAYSGIPEDTPEITKNAITAILYNSTPGGTGNWEAKSRAIKKKIEDATHLFDTCLIIKENTKKSEEAAKNKAKEIEKESVPEKPKLPEPKKKEKDLKVSASQ